MLAVSTVYAGWQAGDWMDAYLPNKGHQIIFIQRLDAQAYSIYFLVYMKNLSSFIMQGVVKPDFKLWIEEGINGVMA
jgi:hypothetical protein